MDRAYEGDETLQLARELGYVPVVPPNPNRRVPWEYDRVLYRRRNEIERLFRRLKGYRRIFSRFDKLDVVFADSSCLPSSSKLYVALRRPKAVSNFVLRLATPCSAVSFFCSGSDSMESDLSQSM